MGSTVLNCKKCRVRTWIDLHKITKMLRLLASVCCLVSVCLSAPQDILPHGLDAAACPNFPFCGPSPADIPDVPGAAAVIAAQQNVLAQERALAGPALPTAIVPGLEAHRAAEAKVLLTHIPGFSAHQAAEAQVSYSRPRLPMPSLVSSELQETLDLPACADLQDVLLSKY